MNSTANGSSGSWSCLNFSALKIGGTVTYCLIIIVSLVANCLIAITVCKTPNLKKTINFFIANMASSDLLFPVFSIPFKLSLLHVNSFLIGGQLGQASCKLLPCFDSVSFVVSIQNLILIAVDRFGAVVFPLRSPLIRSKLCPFFIFATWMFSIVFISPRPPRASPLDLPLNKTQGWTMHPLSSRADHSLVARSLSVTQQIRRFCAQGEMDH